jgi:adenine/guanine phosphoribosyltransferase-like PRPP-binding protein
VNQNRVVSVADLGLVNQQLAQLATAANYLKDVNATGVVTVADKGITNANLAKALPAP